MKAITAIICVCLFLVLAGNVFSDSDFDKVIVMYKPDKTVSVVRPEMKSKKAEESLTGFFDRIVKKHGDLPYDIMDKSELPTGDRSDWEGRKGHGVYINTIKAAKRKREAKVEQLIKKKMRELAIQELKNEGKIE